MTKTRLLLADDHVLVRAEQGASLGVLGIKERAVLAGGSARIISSPGQGATVEILLPLEAADGALPTSGIS